MYNEKEDQGRCAICGRQYRGLTHLWIILKGKYICHYCVEQMHDLRSAYSADYK